jgi:hypothetical protein
MEVSGELSTSAVLFPGMLQLVLTRLGGWVGPMAGLDAVSIEY